MIYYNSEDPSQLMIFTTVIPTDHRLYTLMHYPVYRLGVAWQNVSYNQPPHLGFYIGEGLENIPVPAIYTPRVATGQKARKNRTSDLRWIYRKRETYLQVSLFYCKMENCCFPILSNNTINPSSEVCQYAPDVAKEPYVKV